MFLFEPNIGDKYKNRNTGEIVKVTGIGRDTVGIDRANGSFQAMTLSDFKKDYKRA